MTTVSGLGVVTLLANVSRALEEVPGAKRVQPLRLLQALHAHGLDLVTLAGPVPAAIEPDDEPQAELS